MDPRLRNVLQAAAGIGSVAGTILFVDWIHQKVKEN